MLRDQHILLPRPSAPAAVSLHLRGRCNPSAFRPMIFRFGCICSLSNEVSDVSRDDHACPDGSPSTHMWRGRRQEAQESGTVTTSNMSSITLLVRSCAASFANITRGGGCIPTHLCWPDFRLQHAELRSKKEFEVIRIMAGRFQEPPMFARRHSQSVQGTLARPSFGSVRVFNAQKTCQGF